MNKFIPIESFFFDDFVGFGRCGCINKWKSSEISLFGEKLTKSFGEVHILVLFIYFDYNTPHIRRQGLVYSCKLERTYEESHSN